MSKHHPMQSCKDFLPKPRYRNRGNLAQCWVCGNTFIVRIGETLGHPFWIKVEIGQGMKR